MNIRKASLCDVNHIVTIHQDAFQGYFLTSLGTHFLHFYYSCFIKSNETCTLVVEDEGNVLGFAAATKRCRGFNKRLILSNFFAFGVLSLKMLFLSPKSLLRLVRNLTKKSDSISDDEDYAELYSIGVSKNTQGKGFGKKLLLSSEEILREEGVTRVSLTTDYYDNEKAICFYKAMGYEVLYEFTTYPNRKMYRFIKTIQ